MKSFLKNNISYLIYFAFSIIIEVSTLFVISNKVFISFPFIGLTILGIIFCIYNFMKSNKAKNIMLSILLLLQFILCLVFIVVYDNTGTMFDFNMLRLISSNNNFVVTITINYWFIIYEVFLFTLFILLILYFKKYSDRYYRCKFSLITSSICLSIFLISHIGIVILTNRISEDKFMNSLYNDTNDKYALYGSSANAINELYKMIFFNNYNKLTNEQITDYIYEEVSSPSSAFGVSKGNNLVTILVESFEWFSFVSDEKAYPKGANLSEEKLDALFPNLREFYNLSVVMNNHYSENKTDMSEDEALLGVYPNSDYINYSFENNTMPSAIANVFKIDDANIENNLFHNNDITFYNRGEFSPNLGYDNLYSIEEMVEKGATNYMKDASLKGLVMNLDSEMFAYMKDEMFPVNQRFNTHITTVTMHGDYTYRENIEPYYQKMSDLNIVIENNHLKNYIAYVMDFDKAIGIMMDDLKSKELLENTTIVIFSDHNCYMNHLTNQVKDIYSYSNKSYTELFRVPLMIYDPNIEHQIINKFTTTYDIAVTILDMFGFNYYSNMYYGHSIFSDEESVLYSKALDVFITDKLFFSNINNLLYKDSNVSDDYIKEIENKCKKLLKKIYYTNHLFDYDYFKNEKNYMKYVSNFESIN